MKTIETTAVVGEDRKLTLQLPPHVIPGEHRIVLVIDDNGKQPPSFTMAEWPIHDAGLVDPNFTMRREDLYGDGGR
jgi:hypothetical protein